jgi:hypothetical protein
MDKLDKKDINRVKDTLKDFISKTAGCEDSVELHNKALNILGKAFSDKPSLIKQAASAYNSNKSIFKLSNEDTANTDFGLLNPNNLYNDLLKSSQQRTIEKAASADFVVKFYKDEQPLNKVASAPTKADTQETMETMSPLALENYMRGVLDDRERLLIKSATRRDICAREALDCYESFCLSMNSLTKEARAQVAKNIISVYPVDGKALITRYQEDNKLSKIASFSITAGSRICPQGDIYTKAQACLIAEFAKKQANAMFEKTASDTVEQYKHIPGLYKLYKKAAGFIGNLAGNAFADPLKDVVMGPTISGDEAYQNVVSSRLLNQLREIETQNVLVDMYSEPFIASYPADEIAAATEQALQMLPADQRIHPRKHVSLIKTWVADILGRGGNMSAADTDKILNAVTAFKVKTPDDPANLLKDLQ